LGSVVGDFLFSAIIGGGLAAYLSLRADQAGEYANKFGATLVDAVGVDIPRITLPDAVTEAIKSVDLKSPNDLSTTEYNSYSGAAIGGTLIFFLLPGALIFDLLDALGPVVGDFLFSAIIGGGLAAYLSLRADQAGEYANKFGAALVDAVGSAVDK